MRQGARTFIRMAAVPLWLALAGCAAVGGPSAAAPYIRPDSVDMLRLLPPPPIGEAALADDLAAVRAMQRSRTAERFAQAREDATVSIFRFADVLGSGFNADAVPVTTEFFGKVNRELGRYIGETKNCWRRPRPYEIDPQIQPPEDLLNSTGARRGPPRAQAMPAGAPCDAAQYEVDSYSFSYPSGHTAFGTLTAILLAQMVPEKHIELFERGREYGDSRLVGGVHFPSDIEAGRILATTVAALMMLDERFRADLDAARRELRAALGLP